MSVALWYYVENGARIGPVEATEIERLIGLTTITSDTLVWQDGMQDWMAASQHFSFAGTPPPVNQRGFVQDGLLGETRIPTAINGGAPPRAFCEAISVCFLKYVGFSSRASRSEFWYWVLFSILAGIVTGLIDLVVFGVDNEFSPINSLFSLATFLPSLAVAFCRLHDTGRSGWWAGGYFLVIIVGVVLVGFAAAGNPNGDGMLAFAGLFGLGVLGYTVMLIVFYCLKGHSEPNKYG